MLLLRLDEIRTDGGTQPREQMNFVTATEYAEAMQAGATFPPVVVFYDGVEYWLADGFHRVRATQEAGVTTISADVRQGTVEDARWYSFGANQAHGLRRTNDDKRRAVEAALLHPYAAGKSSTEIAQHCGVSHMTILRYKDILNIVQDAPRLVTRNGTTYTMDTSNIGRPAAPVGTPGLLPFQEYQPPPVYPVPSLAFTPVAEPFTAPVDDSYDGDEWYTPVDYIEAAREVLGEIDLDPATCEAAQEKVKARHFYTKDSNGLELPWFGRLWMNPPYSYPLVEHFTQRAIDHYEDGAVTAAIILVNNCTDAAWFHRLLERYPVCFTRGRVSFWRPDRPSFATRQGQAFFYLGGDDDTFIRVFSRFGVVVAHAFSLLGQRRAA